jgi:hypothetical protein
MISTGRYVTGEKAAITDGKQQVVFDYPSDFADWLEQHPDADLRTWQWCRP